MPVIVRVNGSPTAGWRVNAMPAGDGNFRLYLNGIVRRASGTKVGDRVRLEVSLDQTYRSGPTHPMPTRLRRGLAVSRKAQAAWSALIPSRQKELLRYLASLKSQVAHRKNIDLALEVLGGERRRFLGRDWNQPEEARGPVKG